MTTITHADEAASLIQQKMPGFTPRIGIVLGSGLGGLAEHVTDAVKFSYADLPGFPQASVKGHAGQLICGYLSETPVVCLQGRAHSYEGDVYSAIRTYVRTLKLLGCEYFIATNAAGSLRQDMPPGELMLLTDHINFQPGNVLAGPNDERFGPRFLPLDNAYDPALRNIFQQCAETQGITLHEGVYISVLGPSFETAAEIRAFATLGADAVGMSTVPEVIVARHCDMKVAVISTMTNFATGLDDTSHSHDAVLATAEQAAKNLSRLVITFARRC